MTARRGQASGFTPIEIVITLAVFGMGVLALMRSSLGIKRNNSAGQQTRASSSRPPPRANSSTRLQEDT
jgi:Tfp pilus assembly protein PilV